MHWPMAFANSKIVPSVTKMTGTLELLRAYLSKAVVLLTLATSKVLYII
jgi:hypothetical protein